MTHPHLPEAIRTRAWGLKTSLTQQASWSQLRHDAMRYVKPSTTPDFICEYPYGYVEPVPLFWSRMADMADYAANHIALLNISGEVTHVRAATDAFSGIRSFTTDVATSLTKQEAHFRTFAARMRELRSMAFKELNQFAFSASEWALIDTLITYDDYDLTYGGWYPLLHYAPVFDPVSHLSLNYVEPLSVVDVHTDYPDMLTGDPGGVLHAGVDGGVSRAVMALTGIFGKRGGLEGSKDKCYRALENH